MLGPSFLTLFDLSNLFAKKKKMKIEGWKPNEDFTIIMTVHNNADEINKKILKNYKNKMIICDDESTDKKTIQYLRFLSKKGYKVLRFPGRKGMGRKPIMISSVLNKFIKTKYTIVLDNDSEPVGKFEDAVGMVEKANIDIASLVVIPSRNENFLEKLQNIEYEISMVSRRYRQWLTSGACIIGKTKILRFIYNKHSKYYPGEDIEGGQIAKLSNFNIRHLNFKVKTNVPRTFRSWFKQRVGWANGIFRHEFVNVDKIINPLHSFYIIALIFLFFPLKWAINFAGWWALPLSILIYLPITFIAKWKKKNRYVWFYPLYAAFSVLVFPLLGFLRYLYVGFKYNKWGRYKI